MPTREELLFAPMLKLERAGHHINDLNAQSVAFLAEKPFVLMERHRRKAGETIYSVKEKKPVPIEFSLIIGDAIHNMRAALDLVLFGMAGHLAPKIHYPFPKTAEGMKAAIKEGYVKFAGEKVVEAVKRLDAHPTGNGGLYSIHLLDLQDKHRLLILAAGRSVFTTGTGNEEILKPLMGKEPFKTGVNIILDGPKDTNLLTIRRPYVTRALPDSENEAKVQPAFFISFSESEAMPSVPVVQALYIAAKEARTAVETLVEAFLDPGNHPR